MKAHLLLLVSTSVLLGSSGRAQWCVPTTAIPYAASMPGIVHFTCNTIDRTSADIENFPFNSYVNTGLGTTLVKGLTYPVEIGFTLDAAIAPHMNLRVWIDLNHDGQLDDPGETLLSVDHNAGPTYAGTITVPATAMSGATRLRVTAKMCSHGGHILPTPCDMPQDPLGYHGEIEDYDVTLTDEVGIDEAGGSIGGAVLVPMPFESGSELVLNMLAPSPVDLEVLDAAGRVISSERVLLVTGSQRIPLRSVSQLETGNYVLRLRAEDGVRVVPFVRVR